MSAKRNQVGIRLVALTSLEYATEDRRWGAGARCDRVVGTRGRSDRAGGGRPTAHGATARHF